MLSVKKSLVTKRVAESQAKRAAGAPDSAGPAVATGPPTLRFGVGDKVQCRTSPNEWSAGKVVALNYHDEYMPPGMVAPYQVKLANGALIYAPMDDDQIICKA